MTSSRSNSAFTPPASTSYQNKCTALALCILAGHPVILWGNPGQGKTSVIEAMAAQYGMHMETIIASTFEPADFGGLPAMDLNTGSYTRAPAGWAKRLAEAGSGIAFYDEVSTAPPAVQAALLRPILSRWVGDLELPKGVVSIAAANPADIAADGWDLAPPMANRFVHLNWALDAATVREGFTVGWPQVMFPVVDMDEYARVRQEVRIAVGVFIGSRPDLLTVIPESADESGRAFPTPRTWEVVTDLFAMAQVARVESTVTTLLVQGAVGDAAANEFLTYMANLDLPDPEVVLKDPSKWVVPSERGDKVHAVAASTFAAVNNDLTADRWKQYGRVLARIADASHADVAFLFGRRWVAIRPEGAFPDKDVVGPFAAILNELGRMN